MQNMLTSENLVTKLLELLEPETNSAMRASLREVAHKLGDPGASQRAADVILKFLPQGSTKSSEDQQKLI
jgi:UDP-N-acetylglucosamine:LPS N-acetylglucosamine transferase